MKRFCAGIALSLIFTLLLTACGPVSTGPDTSPSSSGSQPASSSESFVFTRENMPHLDGSTSTVPLAQAMCAVLLGEDQDQVADLINFSRTTQSYRNLMNGQAELLLAAEPPADVRAELEASGKYEMTPFATDALVFVVNQDNPVDNLTTEQIQKIYTGEITNWSEVGGQDMDIVPFQRNKEAGSQTMFEKLVMADLPLMEPPTSWTSSSMQGLLEAVREYDNTPAAIGYTVYYYANDMEMAQGLKVLSIDGVQPSAQAIRAGDYPFLNPYYVTIPSNRAEDDPVRILYNWILGPDGQKLVELEGYVSVTETEG